MLKSELPQDTFLPHPAPRVWQAVRTAVAGLEGTILVEDPQARLLSAVVEIEDYGDLYQGLVADSRRRGRLLAITQAWVREAPGGCRLSLREIYISEKGAAGISHSRGNHERALLQAVRQSLATKGGGGEP